MDSLFYLFTESDGAAWYKNGYENIQSGVG